MAETLSEAAKSFFEQFLKILDDFKKDTGFNIFLLNKEGNLLTKLEGTQPVCKLILSFEEGKIRCKDCFKMGFALAKREKKPIFLECFAEFSVCWLPIIVSNSFLGTVIICGARYEKGESKEILRKKYFKLADQLGIFNKEGFFQKLKETKITTQGEFEKETEKLKKLVDILVENVQTPLKETFG